MRGVQLSPLIELIWGKIAQGGPVMAPIAAVSFAAWVVIIERLLYLRRSIKSNRRAWSMLSGSSSMPGSEALPAGSAATELAARSTGSAEDVEGAAWEVHLACRAGIGRGIGTIGRLASTAPLLGLLGTVSGMIFTFEAIAIHGSGNPRAMAEGISEALVTTEAGLLAAIPALVAQVWIAKLAGRAQKWADASLARAREILSGPRGGCPIPPGPQSQGSQDA